MTIEDVIAKTLRIPLEQVTDEMSPDNTEEWDSFNGLLLATELEKAFQVTFSIEEVISVTCVADIKKILSAHGITP